MNNHSVARFSSPLSATAPLLCVGILVVGLFLSGCAGIGPYRATEPTVARDGYKLGFVEFDDQGWFSTPDRSQISAVEKMIIDESQLTPRSARGIILLVFVHGWKHNASLGDDNVKSFQALLARLAASEAQLVPADRHPVVGVYVGWPGLAAKVEPLKEISFYSRKNTGDKVGYYGAVTETLVRIKNLHSLINGKRGESARSYLVVAGHSFGAQVVFNSLDHILTESLTNRRTELEFAEIGAGVPNDIASKLLSTKDVIKPFGDLVLLVNPAFEASRYYDIKTFSEVFDYAPDQRPVLGIFSSKTDSATRIWFPIGRFFSTTFERYRHDALGPIERDANTHTIPWVDDWVTHELTDVDKAVSNRQEAGNYAARSSLLHANSQARVDSVINNWDPATRVQPIPLAGAVLSPVHPERRWTPFYVTRVDAKIMNEHGGIWGEQFSDFLAEFISISIRHDSRAAPRSSREK